MDKTMVSSWQKKCTIRSRNHSNTNIKYRFQEWKKYAVFVISNKQHLLDRN